MTSSTYSPMTSASPPSIIFHLIRNPQNSHIIKHKRGRARKRIIRQNRKSSLRVLFCDVVSEELMEAEKRKRRDDAEVDDKRRKVEEDGAETSTVTEDEVEEFFAILKRLQMAAKHLKKSDGWDRKLTAEKWRPSFEFEDFEEVRKSKDESVEGNSGLDLNSKPDLQ